MTERKFWIIVGDRLDEYGSPTTYYHIANHEVKFVYQAMRQQVIPKGPAAIHENVFPRFALECGDFVIDMVAADDRCGTTPWSRILKSEMVRYGHLFN
jgi:hypothetical protein